MSLSGVLMQLGKEALFRLNNEIEKSIKKTNSFIGRIFTDMAQQTNLSHKTKISGL